MTAECATASCGTENKGLLTDQPLPLIRGELVQAAGLCCILCNGSGSCWTALRQNLDTTLCSCPVLPQPTGVSKYRFLSLSRAGQLTTSACAFTSITLSQHTWLEQYQTSAVLAFRGGEVVYRPLHTSSICLGSGVQAACLLCAT